jgi:hypothetical protein
MDDEDSDGFESGNAFMTAPKEAIAVGIDPPAYAANGLLSYEIVRPR